jgi:phosphatidylglycerol:prolipoprotein diacylglycerol transferase
MHPILFRVPLPKYPLPVFWVLLAAGGVALAVALWQLAVKNKSAAATAGVIAAGLAGAAFYLKNEVVGESTVARVWELGPVPIYSYGVMLGLSLVVGWYLTLGLAERDGLPKETMANCYVITALAAVAGARILYVLTNLHEFEDKTTGAFEFASMFAMRRGGLVAYGGFLGGFLGSYFFLRRHRIPLLPWADVAVPSLASGLMITRIGCYLFGCDFGRPICEAPGYPACDATSVPKWLQKLGTFPRWAEGMLDQGAGAPAVTQHQNKLGLSPTADHSFPVHPTQLYESMVGLLLLVLILSMRKHQKFRGQIFLLFTFAYGVCRFLLEIVRDDAERGSIPPALAQHVLNPVCLAILAVGYVIGFSRMVSNEKVRRVTQVLAFLPAVIIYWLLKPESYGGSVTTELSTSQAVAVSTGFAASVAFSIFFKAALAHPEAAMDLGLPKPEEEKKPAPEDEDEEDDDDDDDDDEDDDDIEEVAPKKAVKEPSSKPAAKVVAEKPAPKPAISRPAASKPAAKGAVEAAKSKAGGSASKPAITTGKSKSKGTEPLPQKKKAAAPKAADSKKELADSKKDPAPETPDES